MTQIINEYLNKNYKNSDWFNGMTPSRLNNLKGKIKKLDQKEYCLNFEKTDLELTRGTPTFITFFNKNYEIIQEIENSGKTITKYKSFINDQITNREWFDDNGKLIQYEIYDYPINSEFSSKYFIKKLDGSEKSMIFNIEKLDSDSFIYHGQYYDDLYIKNKLIESNSNYISLNFKSLKFKYKYFNGFSIKEQYLNEKLDTIEKYNKNNFLIERIEYDKNGEVITNVNRHYDKNNNLIKIYTTSNRIDFIEPEFFIYDKNNLIIEKKQLSRDNELYTTRQYKYDLHGNLIMEKGDYNNAIFKYKYDKLNNWIEKVEIKSSEIVCRKTREIEYYK